MSAHLDLINYRIEKAKDTLEDARILFNANRLHSTVNRIYYALFYSVLALLHTDNLFSAKHSGVKSIFNERFVKTGKAKDFLHSLEQVIESEINSK